VLLSALTIPATYGGMGGIGLPQSFYDDQEADSARTLREATVIAHEAASGEELSVIPERAMTPAVEALVNRSKDARMVVLGSRGLGEFTAGLLGSVTSAVAHHAHSPVAVIREWPRPTDPTAMGNVVVGVDGSAHSAPAITMAFEEASLRGADLIAVHAWSDVTLSTLTAHNEGLPWASIKAAEQAALAESLAGYSEQYPDVGVTKVVLQDRPLPTSAVLRRLRATFGGGQPWSGRVYEHAARLHQHRPAPRDGVPAADRAQHTLRKHFPFVGSCPEETREADGVRALG